MTLESTIRKMQVEEIDFDNLIESLDEGLDEGRMKELHGYIAKGMSAADIAKKMGLDVKTIEALMDDVDLDEAKYDLYHKDFSTAMQHAYKMAKKMYGITVDPEEIDDKVASGPRKPSEGKTNKYRLKGDKGAIQVQVYNKGGSKPFELNMYKEEVELDEAMLIGRDYEYDEKEGVVKISKKNFAKVKKDSKGSDPKKPMMMVLTKKGTSLVPVKFTEEVELFSPISFSLRGLYFLLTNWLPAHTPKGSPSLCPPGFLRLPGPTKGISLMSFFHAPKGSPAEVCSEAKNAKNAKVRERFPQAN